MRGIVRSVGGVGALTWATVLSGTGLAAADPGVLTVRPTWSTVVADTPGRDESLETVAVDPADGSVVVTGYVPGVDEGMLTARLDATTGAVRSSTVLHGPNLPEPELFGSPLYTVVDGTRGQSITTGTAEGATGEDIVTVAYDAAGHVRWTARYGGSGGGADQVAATALDPRTGIVYVVGSTSVDDSDQDGLFLAYGSDGRRLGSATFSGPNPGAAADVDVLPDGSAVVTGQVSCTETTVDACGGYTASYLPTGTRRWASIGIRPDTFSGGTELTVEPGTGNVYVATTGNADGQVLSYTPHGELRWASTSAGEDFGYRDVNLVLLPDGSTQVFASVDNGFEDAYLRSRRYSRDGQAVNYREGYIGFGIAGADPETGYTYTLGSLDPDGFGHPRLAVVVSQGLLVVAQFTYPTDESQQYPTAMTIDQATDQLLLTGFTGSRQDTDTFVAAYPLLP